MPQRPAISTLRLSLILGALAMFGPFAIDTMFPAFPDMGHDFGVSKFAVQQTISAYLVAYALMSIFHGPLSDSWGRKRVILAGVVVFGLASIGCALSQTLPQLLAFRALQGMSAGAGLIVGRAIIRDCLDGHAAQRLMSAVTMIFSIAPAVAPIVGGWIIAFKPWPSIFWFLALFAVALGIATAAMLPETHPAAHRTPLRLGSMMRSNLAIVRNPQFMRLSLAGGFNFGALFVYIASAPAFVLDILKLNAQQFGWFFVPTIAGMSLGAFISGRLAGRLSGLQTTRLGFAVCLAAGVVNIAYTVLVEQPTAPWAVLPIALNAVGIALVFPILTLAVLDMYPRQRGAASSMQTVVGLAFNTAVAGLLSPFVSAHRLVLAVASAASTVLAWLVWRSYAQRLACEPPGPSEDAAALEPTDGM